MHTSTIQFVGILGGWKYISIWEWCQALFSNTAITHSKQDRGPISQILDDLYGNLQIVHCRLLGKSQVLNSLPIVFSFGDTIPQAEYLQTKSEEKYLNGSCWSVNLGNLWVSWRHQQAQRYGNGNPQTVEKMSLYCLRLELEVRQLCAWRLVRRCNCATYCKSLHWLLGIRTCESCKYWAVQPADLACFEIIFFMRQWELHHLNHWRTLFQI